jgi:hypothetical protein
MQGTAGYMSYQDIEYHLEDGTGTVHYDEEAAVQYLTYAFAPTPRCLGLLFSNLNQSELTPSLITYRRYGDNQWVSYDSVDTIKQKVEFANSQGLVRFRSCASIARLDEF